MQVRNNYDLVGRAVDERGDLEEVEGIFNGDIGVIRTIDPVSETMKILFEGRFEVDYRFSDLEDLEHAWAVTVHKAQGSEYDTVVLALFGTPPMLCRRALLYTAVTRAKGRLILVGDEDLSRKMATSLREELRYSALAERIGEGV